MCKFHIFTITHVQVSHLHNNTCANFTSSQSHTCIFHIFTITHVQISHLHNYTCANFTSSQSHMCMFHSFTITHVQVSQLHIDVIHSNTIHCHAPRFLIKVKYINMRVLQRHSFTTTHVQVAHLHNHTCASVTTSH